MTLELSASGQHGFDAVGLLQRGRGGRLAGEVVRPRAGLGWQDEEGQAAGCGGSSRQQGTEAPLCSAGPLEPPVW